MGILSRFADIIKANINDLIDKAEDPAKMCDQYIRDMTEDLAQVKKETAEIIAEEKRCKRLLDDNLAEQKKYGDLAMKALQAGNEGDAKVFIAKKQELAELGTSLQTAYDAAAANSEKMRKLHDKLTSDIQALKARKDSIKAKVAVAKTQETINKYSATAAKSSSAMGAFARMEEKANKMLDAADAAAELTESESKDDAASLEEKYAGGTSASVEDELAAMKAALGMATE